MRSAALASEHLELDWFSQHKFMSNPDMVVSLRSNQPWRRQTNSNGTYTGIIPYCAATVCGHINTNIFYWDLSGALEKPWFQLAKLSKARRKHSLGQVRRQGECLLQVQVCTFLWRMLHWSPLATGYWARWTAALRQQGNSHAPFF